MPTTAPRSLASRHRHLAAAVLVLACTNLSESSNSIVQLEVLAPFAPVVEVSDTIRLYARALDNGNTEVPATVQWLTADTTITVDPTGLVTGVYAGSGSVRARFESLVSNPISISVVPRPDTLVLVGEDTLRVLSSQDTSAALETRLDTYVLGDTLPASGGEVIYEVIDPVFADPAQRTVELTGQVLIDTVTTGGSGTPLTQVFLSRVGTPTPDSAIVEIRAFRSQGTEVVPGSGQRFVVRFDP